VIVGRVNSDREAIVSLVVQGLQGQSREIEAVVFFGGSVSIRKLSVS
jgi:hypothetical protein